MKALVFLEHHDGAVQKGALGVLAKAASAGDAHGVVIGSGVRGVADGIGTTVWVADDERLEAPLPQPRVDVLAKLVRDEGYDTVLFAQSVLAADVAAGLAARLDAGLNWGLIDFDGTQGRAPQLQDTVVVDVGWSSPVRSASSAPARSTLPSSAARTRFARPRSSSRISRRSPRWSSRRTPSSRGRRSRTPT